MDSAPALISLNTPAGEDYICAMELAGKYAYAGRNWVVNRIAELLGARLTDEIHNYHNFAWKETHFGETFWVVRKGCTPAWPGQKGFVGGSMGDLSVILEGVDSKDSVASLYSTVHGAGRVMSRSVAAGKVSWKNDKDGKKVPQRVSPGQIDWDRVQEELRSKGLELRGGGADEAPAVYKDLRSVLDAHKGTIRILHTLKPIGVAMAGANEFDPYKN